MDDFLRLLHAENIQPDLFAKDWHTVGGGGGGRGRYTAKVVIEWNFQCTCPPYKMYF